MKLHADPACDFDLITEELMSMGLDGDGVCSEMAAGGDARSHLSQVISFDETGLNRENKLPEAQEWAAAHVHARAEKAFARILNQLRVPYFLPLVRKFRFYGARRRESRVPLFSGYVFYDRLAIERHRILETNKVARIIQDPEPRKLQRELSSLCSALAADTELLECRYGQPGSRVIVARGPLSGTEGILIRYQGKDRLILQVQLIGRAVFVDIESGLCEPVL